MYQTDYAQRGFLALQHQVSMALVEYLQQKPLQNVTVVMQRFPYPKYIQDPLLEALESFVSLIFMLSFVYTCINIVRMVTTEKERQLKVGFIF
jgi:ATP-binding cassette subfamily A (ABC1) protein 3